MEFIGTSKIGKLSAKGITYPQVLSHQYSRRGDFCDKPIHHIAEVKLSSLVASSAFPIHTSLKIPAPKGRERPFLAIISEYIGYPASVVPFWVKCCVMA
jgi:hypothetical protein